MKAATGDVSRLFLDESGGFRLRILISCLFAALLTLGIFSVPMWLTGSDGSGLVPADERALGQQYFDDLKDNKLDAAAALMDRAYRPQVSSALAPLRTQIPRGEVRRLTITGRIKVPGDRFGSASRLEEIYDFGAGGAVLVRYFMIRDAEGLKVGGVVFRKIGEAALHANDFKLPSEVMDVRWAILGAAALIEFLTFLTFALCLSSPVISLAWRWLWLIFILIGSTRLSIDIMSLQWEFQRIFVVVPPVTFLRLSAFAPWVMSVGVPVGALVYWAMRFQWRNEDGGSDFRKA